MPRVGVLVGGAADDPQAQRQMAAFKQALIELGWIEGRNIQVDYRFGASDVDRIQRLAKELVESQPDLIVAHTTPVTAALARETRTIPIIFVVVSDPVGSRFVASLSRPGGNPATYAVREFPDAGGLMSYGSNFTEIFRQVGIYTGRILKGEKPADLPLLQATKFELVVNLQTAEALGIEVPATLLAIADEVIE